MPMNRDFNTLSNNPNQMNNFINQISLGNSQQNDIPYQNMQSLPQNRND